MLVKMFFSLPVMTGASVIFTISFETVLNLSISLIFFYYYEDLMFFLQLLPNVVLVVPLLFPSIFQDISVGTYSLSCFTPVCSFSFVPTKPYFTLLAVISCSGDPAKPLLF